MATHTSILAWRIPWTEEPGGLQSIGSQRVGRLKQLSIHAYTLYYILLYLAPVNQSKQTIIFLPPMDWEIWQIEVQSVAKCWPELSN